MDTHRRTAHPETGRVKALYERLARLLRGLPQDRIDALKEHLDHEQASEQGTDHERPTAPSDC